YEKQLCAPEIQTRTTLLQETELKARLLITDPDSYRSTQKELNETRQRLALFAGQDNQIEQQARIHQLTLQVSDLQEQIAKIVTQLSTYAQLPELLSSLKQQESV